MDSKILKARIKAIPLIDGPLPDVGYARYVAIGIMNGSEKPSRTLVRLRSYTENSDHVLADLQSKYPDLKFEKLATGRIEKMRGGYELWRGVEPWCYAIEVANAIRTVCKVRVETVSRHEGPG